MWASSSIFPLCLEHMILLYRRSNKTTNRECGPLPIYYLCVSSTWPLRKPNKMTENKVWTSSNLFPPRLEHMILLYGSQIRRQIVSVGLFQYIPFVSRAYDLRKQKKTTDLVCGPLPTYFLCVSSTWSCCTEGQKYHARLGAARADWCELWRA